MNKRHAQAGLSLINVLVTVLVFSLGLLALGAVYARLVDAQTQNQNLMRFAPWGNSFWGIVQANPGIVTTMAGTYTSANVSAAPAALRGWIGQITNSAASLPAATVVIQTGPDAVSGNACSTTDGCSVTLTITWTQNGSVTRSQVFSYQFGL